jgi:hypothetical protein
MDYAPIFFTFLKKSFIDNWDRLKNLSLSQASLFRIFNLSSISTKEHASPRDICLLTIYLSENQHATCVWLFISLKKKYQGRR